MNTDHEPDIIKTFQVLHISTRTSSKGTIYQSLQLLDSAGESYKVQVFNPHLWDKWGDTLPKEGDYIHMELWKDQQRIGVFLRPIAIRAPTPTEIERFKALQAMRAQGSEEAAPEASEETIEESQSAPEDDQQLDHKELTKLPREELLKMAMEQDLLQRSMMIKARAAALNATVQLWSPEGPDPTNPKYAGIFKEVLKVMERYVATGEFKVVDHEQDMMEEEALNEICAKAERDREALNALRDSIAKLWQQVRDGANFNKEDIEDLYRMATGMEAVPRS